MRKRVKGTWLLGFVRLGEREGLDMRFLGRKRQKKKADACGDENSIGDGKGSGNGYRTELAINLSLRLFESVAGLPR
jgi:hypothetical protein